MDLTIYYQKVREAQAKLTEDYVVVISKETPDGGKPGVCTEVPRAVAARMFVDGLAEKASVTQAEAFRETQAKAKKEADDLAASSKVTFNVQEAAHALAAACGLRASGTGQQAWSWSMQICCPSSKGS